MGTGHQKDQVIIRSLELLVPSPILQREEGTGNQVNDQSHLGVEASIKIPKVWGSGSFQVVKHIYVSGGWSTPTLQGQKFYRAWALMDLALSISSVYSF